MKKICFLLLLYAAANPSFAQTTHPQQASSIVNPRLDKQEKEGFTIVLKPAIRNTFLFSVYQKGTLLHAAMRHPVSKSATGFKSRDEAFRAAGWMIGVFKESGVFPEAIPADDARRLQLLPHAN